MTTTLTTLTSPEVCAATGLSYRRLDYMVRTNLIPTKFLVNPAHGSGSQRAFAPAVVHWINEYLYRLEQCPRCGTKSA